MGVGIYFRETRPQFLLLTPACVCVGVGTAAWVKGGLGNLPVSGCLAPRGGFVRCDRRSALAQGF